MLTRGFDKDLQRFYRFRDDVMGFCERLREAHHMKWASDDCRIELIPLYNRSGHEPSEVAITMISSLLGEMKKVTWRGDTLAQAVDLAWPEVMEWMEITKEEAGMA